MVRNQEQVVGVGEAEVAQGIEEEGDYSHHQQEGGHPHPGQPCFILSNCCTGVFLFIIWPSQKVFWLSGPHYNWSNSADIDIEK